MSGALTGELLELLWLVEATLAAEPELDDVLDEIASGGEGQTWPAFALQQT